jgi:hypothetical protein
MELFQKGQIDRNLRGFQSVDEAGVREDLSSDKI